MRRKNLDKMSAVVSLTLFAPGLILTAPGWLGIAGYVGVRDLLSAGRRRSQR